MKISDLPLRYNCVSVLEHNLETCADKVALYSDERMLTFRQISTEVNRVANALKKLGTRAGDFVGILSPDLPEWVTSFFGTVKVGAVAVGMNTMLTSAEYAFILDDSRTRVLIVHDSLLPTIDEIRADRPFLEHVVVIGASPSQSHLLYDQWLGAESPECSIALTHREDSCTLNYTSGTTGQPKGIQHAHKDMPLSSQLYTVNTLGLASDDRTFCIGRLFFTFALGVNLFSPWHVGASTVLTSRPPRVATNVLETIDRFKPTFLFNVPTGYASMMAVEEFMARYDLSSLRVCVASGEPLPMSVWQAWKQRTGIEIIESIGATETFALFLSNRPNDVRPGSLGKPVDGFEMRVVNANGGLVPPGEVGELLLKGETFSLSYLHQYHKTQNTFRGEWLFTGDKVLIDDDGYYHYVGRSDDMLKAGGIWVSPLEIETTLRNHRAVYDCAVVGHADKDGLLKPKAFIVLRPGFIPEAALEGELIDHCRTHMAAYKRPRWVQFVTELPRTATGKVRRSALRTS